MYLVGKRLINNIFQLLVIMPTWMELATSSFGQVNSNRPLYYKDQFFIV
jgi:hypothetical protein